MSSLRNSRFLDLPSYWAFRELDDKDNLIVYQVRFTPDDLKFVTENMFYNLLYELKGMEYDKLSFEEMFNNKDFIEKIIFPDDFELDDVISFRKMFSNCTNLKVICWPLRKFDTSTVVDTSFMFHNCVSLETILLPDWFDTSNVENMSCMFWRCKNLKDISLTSFDTSKVKDMSMMFSGCENIQIISLLPGFSTENVKFMNAIFSHCNKLHTVVVPEKFGNSTEDEKKNVFGCHKEIEFITQ